MDGWTQDRPSPSQLLPNALLLSQSRARLAEEQLRTIEDSCRKAWHAVSRREQDCLLELRKVEGERTSLHATLMRQMCLRQRERLEDVTGATSPSHGGLSMQICLAQQPDETGNIANGRSFVRECFEMTDLCNGGDELYDERGRAAMASALEKVKRLEQQSASLSAARVALEKYLAPFIFPHGGSRSLYNWSPSGQTSVDPMEHGGIWSSFDVAGMNGQGSLEGFGAREEETAVRLRRMEECHVADLQQRVEVAERAALETVQRACSEVQRRNVREQALHAAIQCCQRELHSLALKLEDSQKQYDGLKKENKRLARRLRHQARLLGGNMEGDCPLVLENDRLEVNEISYRPRHGESYGSQSHLQLFTAAGACLRRGLDRAVAFIARLFHAQRGDTIQVTHPHGYLAVSHNHEASDRLAPSLCTTWESGPMWEVFADDGGEFDEVWDKWGDDEGISHTSNVDESWHTVFFIQVIFTWQEAFYG